jgi:hypothetical protein
VNNLTSARHAQFRHYHAQYEHAKTLTSAKIRFFYTEPDVRQRLMAGNAFLSRVLEQLKIWIIGNESDIPT